MLSPADIPGQGLRAPESLRKRQTILQDIQKKPHPKAPNTLGVPLQNRRVSSSHARNRSVSRQSFLFEDNAAVADAMDPLLSDPNLDAESLVAHTLSKASAEEITRYMENLKIQLDDMEKADADATKKSYESMLGVTRDVADLAPELARMRKLLGDLSAVTNAMRSDALDESESAQGHRGSVSVVDTRASIMMLNTAWQQDLANLFRRVEGAQKYLPAIAGRHVVMESANWYELNSVTWQPAKPVVMFVLNDHFLVASKLLRRGRDDSRALAVDECWPLTEIRVDELPSSVVAGGGLQVTCAAGRWTYRPPPGGSVQTLVQELKRAQALTQRSGRHSRNPSASTGQQANVNPQRLSSNQAVANLRAVQDVSELRNNAKIIADIDLRLVSREWTKAAEIIVENKKVPGVDGRRKELESALLSHARAGDEQVLGVCAALGLHSDAIDAFLVAKKTEIHQWVSDVSFRGDIVTYLGEVAIISFQLVCSTVRAFFSAFPEPEYSSRLVAWVKDQVTAYAEVFNRQLYNISSKSGIYQKCVELTRRESAQLKSLGLDMDFVLDYAWGNPK